MTAFSIARQSFFQPFNKKLILTIGPYYLLIAGLSLLAVNFFIGQISGVVGASNSSGFDFFARAFLYIFELIFFPILMTGLRADQSNSKFIFPKLEIIFKKAKKVFNASISAGFLITLGTLCFVIPGIVLAKRFIYVSYIAEKEMIGPQEAREKSRTLASKNGWSVILACLYCFIPYLILSVPINYFFSFVLTSFPSSILLDTLLVNFVLWFPTVLVNSLIFNGYLKAEKSCSNA